MTKGTLIVEGQDDRHVMYSLFSEHDIEFKKYFNIVDLEGVDNFLDNLKTAIKASSRVGIILDADIDTQARWTSVRDRLHPLGFDLPEIPDPNGTIVDNPQGDRVGVWLMPNNVLPGMLEDFLSLIVPDDDILLPKVIAFVDSLPEGDGRFKSVHRAKAIIHTYLAIRDEPTSRFATAVKAKHFDAWKDEARNLLNWVNQVLVA